MAVTAIDRVTAGLIGYLCVRHCYRNEKIPVLRRREGFVPAASLLQHVTPEQQGGGSNPPTRKQRAQHVCLCSRDGDLLQLRGAIRKKMFMPPVAVNDVGAGCFQESYLARNFFRQQIIVRVEELDVVAARQNEAAVARSTATSVRTSLGDDATSEFLNLLPTTIRRTVIDHDHFDWRIRLI